MAIIRNYCDINREFMGQESGINRALIGNQKGAPLRESRALLFLTLQTALKWGATEINNKTKMTFGHCHLVVKF